MFVCKRKTRTSATLLLLDCIMIQLPSSKVTCCADVIGSNCKLSGNGRLGSVGNYRSSAHFSQGPTAYAPLTYEAPALPHILCLASVCRCWFQSVKVAVCGRFVANVHHLLRTSHLRHDTSGWFHRPSEDCFRLRSWLIDEINVCRITNPLLS